MRLKQAQKVTCRINGVLKEGVIMTVNNNNTYDVIIPGKGVWVLHELDVFVEPAGTSVEVDSLDKVELWANEVADNIRHQPHYEQFKIQPVVFIAENNLDFLTGNIIKYVLRHGKKNGLQDLEKAKHYLDMLIQKVKGEDIKP